ncbi:MAG: MlaD family protein [Solirubrobacteraceae bacterium]
MRRIFAIALVLAAGLVILVVGTGAKDDGGTYLVRAIFDTANSVTTGEQVRIAGVPVGTIQSLDVTPDKKAAVVLDITDGGYQDFRTDAHCTIRPQSLIGEQYVECDPTLPRAAGQPEAPPLRKIEEGPGKGQYLLPLANTSSPVGIDLINDIMRVPQRQRLGVILNEFGVGFAANGVGLNAAIKRANPALQQTDQVLAILAKQNKILANLATESDTVLAPLARDRAQVRGFINSANAVGRATAEKGAALQENLRLLPPFLRQLTPTVNDLSAFADQATPVFADLGSVAPSVNTMVEQLGPFSAAAIPAFESLGTTTDTAARTLTASKPTISAVNTLSQTLRPVASNLGALTSSLRKTGGFEFLMRFAYYTAAATNGFDRFGHYLRAEILTAQVAACSTPGTTFDPGSGCGANFAGPEASRATVSPAADRARALANIRALGRAPQAGAPASPEATGAGGAAPAERLPAPPKAAGTAAPRETPQDRAKAGVLDYLLGGSQ